jgi:hypothetical protein
MNDHTLPEPEQVLEEIFASANPGMDMSLWLLAHGSFDSAGKFIPPTLAMCFFRVEGYEQQPPYRVEECQERARLLSQQLSEQGGLSATALAKYHPLIHLVRARRALELGYKVRFLKATRPEAHSVARMLLEDAGGLELEDELEGAA